MRIELDVERVLRDPFPGLVEAALIDANGFRWQIVDKVPAFDEYSEFDLAQDRWPARVSVRAEIINDDGGPTVDVRLPHVDDRVYRVRRQDLLA